jgi:phosphoribosylglycinamide formyltransferase 2
MSASALESAQEMAAAVTKNLGGYGLFGVEMFVKNDEVIFSEVSPRPHDTGMVTMISQDLSQFALHARAILGLPIPNIQQHGPSASCALVVEGHSENVRFDNIATALAQPDTQLRLFGKPKVAGKRRMAVALARGTDVEFARATARKVSEEVVVIL